MFHKMFPISQPVLAVTTWSYDISSSNTEVNSVISIGGKKEII